MKKIFVLDTNVFLNDPYAFFGFADNEVVISSVVIEEIDSKKRLMDDVGRNAREFSRKLDLLREQAPLNIGVKTPGGGLLRVEMNHQNNERMSHYFPAQNNDNRIISVAYTLHEQNKADKTPVILVSNDAIVRIKADSLGLRAESYRNDQVVDSRDKLYTGFRELTVPGELIDRFYKEHRLDMKALDVEAYPHEFFILKDQEASNKSAIGRCRDAKTLEPFFFLEDQVWGIHPRNVQQKMALELLLDDTVSLVTVSGRAGTGKTLLALATALSKVLDEKRYVKLLVARPVIPMGRDIGFLPGEKDEKLRPWMQPIYDNLEYLFSADEKNPLENMMAGTKSIEIEALTYIRGRSLPKQFIIIDEAQNLTRHEAKTIISRVGEQSKIILVGDPEQIDHPYIDSISNGLSYTVEQFKEQHIAGHVTLIKGERSELAELAATLL
ncbi:PhoH family protein [Clostridia bacterium]|nr:PhoH family protein [Clostridia bacterium]